ncbi:MAG: gliding motility-associated C-terminal domain-containing protein [Bacteroidia bacterium]|nr:gliding motility-associated C-terminal domain-containing protein [Bacteroidia bacterium]
MKFFSLLTGLVFLHSLFGQITPQIVPGTCAPPNTTTAKIPAPFDGSGSLGQTYTLSKCGLNYVTATNKLGQRFSPPGVLQPATYSIAGLPVCAVIEKAFLYMDASGNGMAVTATITNPANTTQNFPMTMIGNCQDKCWGYSGTYSYRADVTSIIQGNGNYMVSGLPTSTTTPGNDADGATLIIIYSDPSMTYLGDIVIWDGCNVGIGTQNPSTMTGLSVCATPSLARGFLIIADFQSIGGMVSVNGSPYFNIADDWWNFVDQSTTVTSSQTNSTFGADGNGSDCFNLMMIGLYWQTTACTTCVPQSGVLPVTATNGSSACNPCSGTSTVTPNGGTPPYSYTWNTVPVQTTQTATGLCPGTYIVTVSDAACLAGMDTIVISSPNPVTAGATSTNVACFGQSTGTATATPSGGTAPFTYNWSPSGGTNSTATGLTAGTYTVTITDANGCTATATVTITQPGQLLATASALVNVTCAGGTNGSAGVNPAGGTPPYSYLWSPSSQTLQTATGLAAGIYTVTITDVNGCSTTATVTVTQPAPMSAPTTTAADTCGMSTGSVNVNVTGGTGPYTYSWAPVNGNGAALGNLNGGTYTVTITDANGCTTTATGTVNSLAGPTAAFTVNPMAGSSSTPFSVTDGSTGGSGNIIAWFWNFGDSSFTSQNPPTQYLQGSGTHCIELVVVSNLGCRDTANICLEIVDSISVPNVITPNGDSHNEYLVFDNLDQFPGSRIVIYNRWGNLIYETADYLNNWNAMDVSDGVYYFVLWVADSKNTVKAGWVAVMGRGKK